MTKNLTSETGTAVHANNGQDLPKCSPRMVRPKGFGGRVNEGVTWLAVDAPVTCCHCLGTKATSTAKRTPVAKDAFEVGQDITTRTGTGRITKLTASMVTYTDAETGMSMAAKRSVLRGLNG